MVTSGGAVAVELVGTNVSAESPVQAGIGEAGVDILGAGEPTIAGIEAVTQKGIWTRGQAATSILARIGQAVVNQ